MSGWLLAIQEGRELLSCCLGLTLQGQPPLLIWALEPQGRPRGAAPTTHQHDHTPIQDAPVVAVATGRAEQGILKSVAPGKEGRGRDHPKQRQGLHAGGEEHARGVEIQPWGNVGTWKMQTCRPRARLLKPQRAPELGWPGRLPPQKLVCLHFQTTDTHSVTWGSPKGRTQATESDLLKPRLHSH